MSKLDLLSRDLRLLFVYLSLMVSVVAALAHRYYKIEDGTHVDSYYDRPGYQDQLRPILPCHRAAFRELEKWVERGNRPPRSKLVQMPGSGDVVNRCSLGKRARYSAPGS